MAGQSKTAGLDQPTKTRRIDEIATDLGTRALLGSITAWLTAEDVAGGTIATVELVLAEAINNIVEHAYADCLDTGVLSAQVSLFESYLEVSLRDRGSSFPDGTLPSGDLPDLEVALELLPEGGFGWYLIFSQAKSVDYTREAGQNTLLLSFELDTDRR